MMITTRRYNVDNFALSVEAFAEGVVRSTIPGNLCRVTLMLVRSDISIVYKALRRCERQLGRVWPDVSNAKWTSVTAVNTFSRTTEPIDPAGSPECTLGVAGAFRFTVSSIPPARRCGNDQTTHAGVVQRLVCDKRFVRQTSGCRRRLFIWHRRWHRGLASLVGFGADPASRGVRRRPDVPVIER